MVTEAGEGVMRHDGLCEHDPNATTAKGLSCECATRAYKADPLPDDVTPIWIPVWARNTEDE
jgi:hypothetical protein